MTPAGPLPLLRTVTRWVCRGAISKMPAETEAAKPPLDILLCAPRGFCAGVDRAVQIVELALERFGPPVYVRHEIVHNRFVVDSLKAKGAVFV